MIDDDPFFELSEFIEYLYPLQEDGDQGIQIESCTVSLPFEMEIERGVGFSNIRIASPLRTETSIAPVLHQIKLRVVCDAIEE